MPASTDSTMVSTITRRPSSSERWNAAPMSTMPPPAKSCENQCSDPPRIGKVRPPSGPWNDRMKMTIIGPYRNST